MTGRDGDIRESLRRVPMFASLGGPTIDWLVGRCRTRTCKAGDLIFAEEGDAEQFFVVLAGRVVVYKLSPAGDRQILHMYGPGQTFAEAAVLAGGVYPAHAEAAEEVRLLAVPGRVVREAVEREPRLALGMLAGMAAKLHEFATLIEALSLKEVPARVAGALLEEADRAGGDRFRLPGTKGELAAQLGTAAETLSRALTKLGHAGVISVKGREISIRDRTRLEQLASE